MSDLPHKLQLALEKAAEYELLGSLANEPSKRAQYRTFAEFEYSVAHELRKLMAEETGVEAQPLPHMPVVTAKETRE
jgi:hypothetical protein